VICQVGSAGSEGTLTRLARVGGLATHKFTVPQLIVYVGPTQTPSTLEHAE
jgi:hypothetical protein